MKAVPNASRGCPVRTDSRKAAVAASTSRVHAPSSVVLATNARSGAPALRQTVSNIRTSDECGAWQRGGARIAHRHLAPLPRPSRTFSSNHGASEAS